MKNIILVFIFVLSFSRQAMSEDCSLCSTVEKLVSEIENGDDKKAYENFERLLMTTTVLSDDGKIRQLEMNSLVSGTSHFLVLDEQQTLADYLLTLSQKYKNEFLKAHGGLTIEKRKSLDLQMKLAEGIRKNGESFADPDKKLDEIEEKKKGKKKSK